MDLSTIRHQLINACTEGNLEIVKKLVSSETKIKNKVVNNALIRASLYGHLKIIKYLVSQGANIRVRHDTALHYAVGNGFFDIVKYLVETGAPVDGLSTEVLDYIAFSKKND